MAGNKGNKNRKYGRNKRKKNPYSSFRRDANKKRSLIRAWKRSEGKDKQAHDLLKALGTNPESYCVKAFT